MFRVALKTLGVEHAVSDTGLFQVGSGIQCFDTNRANKYTAVGAGEREIVIFNVE